MRKLLDKIKTADKRLIESYRKHAPTGWVRWYHLGFTLLVLVVSLKNLIG